MAFIYCVPPREVLFELTTVLEEEEEEARCDEEDEARARGRRPSSVRVQLHVADLTRRRSGDGAERLSAAALSDRGDETTWCAGSGAVIHPLSDAAEAYIRVAGSRRGSSAVGDDQQLQLQAPGEAACCRCDQKPPAARPPPVVECAAAGAAPAGNRLASLVSGVRQRLQKAGINDVLLVTVLVLILVTVSLLTSIFEHHDGQSKIPPPGGSAGTDNALDETWFVSRELWQAGQRSPYLPLVNTTLRLVVVTHTVTKTCNSLHSCELLVKSIQSMQVAHQGYQDISFNFLVGGDGRVYEGRGWSVHAPVCNYQCISVAFIGDYRSYGYNTKVTPDQIKYFSKLLGQGVSEQWLSSDYYIIPLCLIENTESPGDKLFSALQHMPHFSQHPFKVINNSCSWPTPQQDIENGPNSSPNNELSGASNGLAGGSNGQTSSSNIPAVGSTSPTNSTNSSTGLASGSNGSTGDYKSTTSGPNGPKPVSANGQGIVANDQGGGSNDQGGGSNNQGGGSNNPGGGSNNPGGGSNNQGGGSNNQGGGSNNPGGGSNNPGGGSNNPGSGSNNQGSGSNNQGSIGPADGSHGPGGDSHGPGGGSHGPGGGYGPGDGSYGPGLNFGNNHGSRKLRESYIDEKTL